MTPRGVWVVVATVVGSLALAGCTGDSGSPSSQAGSTSSTESPTTSGSTARSATSVLSTTTTASTPSVTSVAENLPVTDLVRSQLVAAGAALNSVPATAYTGLVPGTTYYAYDTATDTYWAGAGLVPSASSQQAQVSVQDDGSYLLFRRPAGASWTAWDVGLSGIEGSRCPTAVPPAILSEWGWAAGTCRPAS